MAEEDLEKSPALHCQRLCMQTAELGAEIGGLLVCLLRTKPNMDRIEQMIRRCRKLDQELVDWSASLPDYFRWTTVSWVHGVPHDEYAKALAFPGRLDAYNDLYVPTLWNMMRCSRCILASKVLRCVAWLRSPGDYRTTPEYAAESRLCIRMIEDIIASVPYQLGQLPFNEEGVEQRRLSTFACGDDKGGKSLSGIFLIWPLACIQSQDFATDSQRAWVKGRLAHIGSQLGIRYAHILVHVRPISFALSYEFLTSCAAERSISFNARH